MKGMVFTEFLEMVEGRHSPALLEQVIEDARLPNGGAYTAVGTYPAGEMVRLVVALGERTNTPVPDLLRTFGRHLFGHFLKSHPRFFSGPGAPAGPLEFLESIDRHIHVEVKKLYNDAELPVFECRRPSPAALDLTYRSSRAMADLAEGLILASFDHYGQAFSLEREDLSGGAGTVVCFRLRR